MKDSILFMLFFIASLAIMQAQTNQKDICKDGDCSPRVFDIQLNQPLKPGNSGYTSERTEAFQNAYLQFKEISKEYVENAKWQANYETFQLAGKSCFRYYQLESWFAYEHEFNPDFAEFIREQESDIPVFQKQGFKASRRALNLKTRMDSHCPRELRNEDPASGLSLENLRLQYKKLGQIQGYFDEDGNLMKSFDIPENQASDKLARLGKNDQIQELKLKLNSLPTGSSTANNIAALGGDLKEVRPRMKDLKRKSEDCKSRIDALIPRLNGFQNRLNPVKNLLSELKSFNPNRSRTGLLAKINNLSDRGENLFNQTNLATEKVQNLKDRFDNLTKKSNDLEKQMEEREGIVKKMEKRLNDLKSLKTDLTKRLEDKPKKILDELTRNVNETVDRGVDLENKIEIEKQLKGNFLKQVEDLEAEKNLIEKELSGLEKEADLLDEEGQTLEKEADKLEDDLKNATAEELELERQTYDLEYEMESGESLKREEEALKKEFGKDIKLEPVTMKEWSENYEVKRPYWDAVFHPDDEVVKGFSGRYFEVKLKDADKNVKLLFGPGEYFMDKTEFRENYGSVIGAFVTEALHAVKKVDKSKVKLFIQGGADIVGQHTFKGNLNSEYLYEEVTFLPQIEGQGGFLGTPTKKSIPRSGFRNNDLPNLRGNFLREMVSIYSKKLNPILLEGEVTSGKNAGDRNAIIYLFIPEELTE